MVNEHSGGDENLGGSRDSSAGGPEEWEAPLGAGAEGMEGGEDAGVGGVRRPTPARKAMEGSDPDEGGGGEERRVLRLPAGGGEWVVTVSGRSASGVLPLRTVPLMELSFSPSLDPQAPPRRILSRGESLMELQEEELLALLSSLLGHDSRAGRGGGRSR